MCTSSTTFVIDHEFAFYGPMGFDVGAFLANVLLAYFSQDGHEKTGGGDRSASRAWLLETFTQTWHTFERRFLELWDEKGVADGTAGITPASVYGESAGEEALRAAQKAYVKGVLRDSLAFAGAKMTRRVVGIAHVADLESIADPDVRAKCELAALACGRRLILEADELSIDDVAAAAESLRAKF
jgi:5-methylthioribose kinase